MTKWNIGPLGREHDRGNFDCGHPKLNEWLRQRAGQFDRKGLARTFVAVPADSKTVCGYYSLSSHQIVYEALPHDEVKGLPSIDVPVVLLGRLAVDRQFQRQGLGAALLIDALRRVQQIGEQIGIRAVVVDAIDDSARKFYEHFGFKSLVDDRLHLFLPLSAIKMIDM